MGALLVRATFAIGDAVATFGARRSLFVFARLAWMVCLACIGVAMRRELAGAEGTRLARLVRCASRGHNSLPYGTSEVRRHGITRVSTHAD